MKNIIGNLIFLPLAFSITSTALADEEYADEFVIERCISARILRAPEIIDDGRIAFHASGNRIYLNKLLSNCPGLKREGRISYEVGGHLCENDRINILERSGSKFRLGISCRLGSFEPISKEDLEELHEPSPVPPEPQPVEQPEIEDVVED